MALVSLLIWGIQMESITFIEPKMIITYQMLTMFLENPALEEEAEGELRVVNKTASSSDLWV